MIVTRRVVQNVIFEDMERGVEIVWPFNEKERSQEDVQEDIRYVVNIHQ